MKPAKGMSRLREQIQADKAPPPAPEAPVAKERKPDARIGKQMIAGYFSTEMARQFSATAALQGKTVQALLGEAIDGLMPSYGVPPFGER